MAKRLEQTPYFAIASLRDRDPVPGVCTLAAAVFDGPELGATILEFDTVKEALLLFIAERAEDTNRILALEPESGMHELVGEFP